MNQVYETNSKIFLLDFIKFTNTQERCVKAAAKQSFFDVVEGILPVFI